VSDDPTKDLGQKYDAQPTIETVVQMLSELREHMDARFDRVDARLDKIERKISILNDDVLSIRADLAGIDQRVTKLEESRA
jgi:tetrahydromethanopterin S-methyltransferase subunit G